jgi:signal transduction histidine kinase
MLILILHICLLMAFSQVCFGQSSTISLPSSATSTLPQKNIAHITLLPLTSQPNAFGFSGLSHWNMDSVGWRYLSGDNIAWASPLYKDSSDNSSDDSSSVSFPLSALWQRHSSPRVPSDSVAWNGIGWFRLHVRVSPPFRDSAFSLVVASLGAMEVYLDGNLIGRYGTVSGDAEHEMLPQYARFLLRPHTIKLSDTLPHLLAIRYSFSHYEEYCRRFYLWKNVPTPGIQVVAMRTGDTERYNEASRLTILHFGVCVGMPMLSCILHLVLFWLYRKDKTNLFVALLAFAMSFGALLVVLMFHDTGQGYPVAAWADFLIGFIMGLGSLSLYYSVILLYRDIPRWHWVFVGCVVTAIFLSNFFGLFPRAWYVPITRIRLVLFILPVLYTIYIVIQAVRKRQEGAVILSIGIAAFVSAWILDGVFNQMGLLFASRPPMLAFWVRFGLCNSLPLSLSILLARRAAHQSIQIAKQNEILEEKVRERTVDLNGANLEISRQLEILGEQSREIEMSNATLQEQNETLETLNQEKNELMAIVAHDLKNPIAAIRGLADLVHSGMIEQDETPPVLGQIVQTSDRMLELVKNLLDVNRLESGGIQMSIVSFDILPVIHSMQAQYEQQAKSKNIHIFVHNTATVSTVLADEQAVIQVLDNLISNAVKYSPHGKQVFVRVLRNAQNVRVEVQDEGEGISEADMTKLFGKFARLSARPTGGEHSTGLGLSIVKKMVEAMNGRVWCESELGKGATFIVKLPSVSA